MNDIEDADLVTGKAQAQEREDNLDAHLVVAAAALGLSYVEAYRRLHAVVNMYGSNPCGEVSLGAPEPGADLSKRAIKPLPEGSDVKFSPYITDSGITLGPNGKPMTQESFEELMDRPETRWGHLVERAFKGAPLAVEQDLMSKERSWDVQAARKESVTDNSFSVTFDRLATFSTEAQAEECKQWLLTECRKRVEKNPEPKVAPAPYNPIDLDWD